jgi:hypothetical protein
MFWGLIVLAIIMISFSGYLVIQKSPNEDLKTDFQKASFQIKKEPVSQNSNGNDSTNGSPIKKL